MEKTSTKLLYNVTAWALTFFLVALFLPAAAQISYMGPADMKAEMKQSKRDAKKFDADHKETHLDMSSVPVKPGESGRKSRKIEETPTDYLSDSEIDALGEQKQPKEKPKKKLLFFRKK